MAPYDEAELENYYEILNVSHDASDPEIREHWIELMKSHPPDKVGQGELARKINEAYDVLGSASKRVDYDARYAPDVPIVVRDKASSSTSRILLYLFPFMLVVGASYLYLSSSGLIFQPEIEEESFTSNVENPVIPDEEFTTEILISNKHNSDPDNSTKQDENSSFIRSAKENNDGVKTETEEENKSEFVKIIPDENNLQNKPKIETIEEEKGFSPKPIALDAGFDSKLAMPAVAVKDREYNNKELSPNTPASDTNSLFEFVSRYVSAYKNRDLQTIRTLFAPNARENVVSIYKVLDTYKSNFSTLDIIRYDININRSSIDNSAGILMGDFIVTFLNHINNLTKSSRGSITWLLRWRGHKWEIEEINYKIYDTNVIYG